MYNADRKNMPRIDNRKFYITALQKYGANAKGVHWNSETSQEKRFETLLQMLPRDVEYRSIVDAGCGFADLQLYMKRRGMQPKMYTGLEIMPEMVEEARRRTGCEIRQCDVLCDPIPEADYYLCSGAMNILERFETHLFIRRCYEQSRRAFVFNILEGSDESMVYNYFTEHELRHIADELGAFVKVQKGYLPKDITVALFKEAN